jgi:hypothetical protein
MRAKEIFENKNVADLPAGARDVMPPSLVIPDLDGGYYELYRMLIALAGLPDTEAPLSSVVKDHPYISPYSDYEKVAVAKMLKKMGKHPQWLSKKHSEESPEINKTSPVRKFKDYCK